MKWKIVIILLYLNGCTYHSYDKEKYNSWYNETENESSKRERRVPIFTDRRNLF